MQKTQSLIIKILFVVVILGIAFYFGKTASSNEAIQGLVSSYGYIGIFLLSIASGFNIIVPIPVISFLPLFIESGLSFWITIFVISLGLTAGDALGFFIGRIGREAVSAQSKKIIERLEYLRTKYQYIPLIVMFVYASLVPLPNEVLVIPLAFMGYKLKTLFPIVLIGNILFNTLFGQTIVTIFEFL